MLRHHPVSGIYAITNTINGHLYIGSSQNVQVRWNDHKRLLSQGTHENKHLRNAWSLYGRDAFNFQLLEECAVVDLLRREQQRIDSYPREMLYNIALFAGEAMRGVPNPHTSEWNAKIGIGNKGKTRSPEFIAFLRAAATGHVHSDAHKAKISASLKGRSKPQSFRQKLSEIGRTRSPELQARMNEGMRRAVPKRTATLRANKEARANA